MSKTILITGSTDGIGLATAKMLITMGHRLLLHGRNRTKLKRVKEELSTFEGGKEVETYLADLSSLQETKKLAENIANSNKSIDVLINNAGVYTTDTRITCDRLDVRFAVNTIAPYLLTKELLPIMNSTGRVINLSSAAQSPVNPDALIGGTWLMDDEQAYAQSKLALTMWSRDLASVLGKKRPAIIALNPKSMLGTEMVKQAYGVNGYKVEIGAEILCKAALSKGFASASGLYFDNDIGRFANPHPDALAPLKCKEIVSIIESILTKLL